MGVRAARGRTRAFAQGADRRSGGDRDAGDRAAGPARCFRRDRRNSGGGRNGCGEAAMMRLLRSAFVIGRRDFSATVLSKTFLFFLLGPVFPLLLGGVFGGIGARVANQTDEGVIAVLSSTADFGRMYEARERLANAMGDGV